ncbi:MULTISPECIES: magnesium transporter [unclassified Oceanobacillus]|uniref:magnesium transporter n=1 Tax=unclassified Oceanobacillus TaxID=2630292 RepID=UPI00300E3709
MFRLDKENRERYTKNIIKALNENDKEEFRESYLELHPSDQVDIFITLDKEGRERVYMFLEPKEFAVIFSGLYFIHQQVCIEELSDEYTSEMLNNMFTDDTVNFLKRINQEEATQILGKLEEEKAEKIQVILDYDLETAGAVMTYEYITAFPEETAANLLDKIRREGSRAEIVYYTYVIDKEGYLKGVVTLKKLITADPNDAVRDLMHKYIVSIPANMGQEDIGKVIQKYDLLALPVVTEQNRLLGIITVDDVMDIIELQTTKSFGEFSTVKDATETDTSAFTAAKKRAPWIVFLMFAGMITSGVIGQFEETLESVVVLAAFMPMLMDSGGNVGTQSLAVSVRGLALGTIDVEDLWRMIRKEFSTGFLIGFVCMVLISILILIFYGNIMLGVVVGLSILVTLSISAVIGLTFPLILNKLKFDPAIASGPFITTINDIIALMIYFSIATTFMNYL